MTQTNTASAPKAIRLSARLSGDFDAWCNADLDSITSRGDADSMPDGSWTETLDVEAASVPEAIEMLRSAASEYGARLVGDPEAVRSCPARKILVTTTTRTVGDHFGTVGQLINALDGSVMVEGPTKPYGMTSAALAAVEALAEEGGYEIVEAE